MIRSYKKRNYTHPKTPRHVSLNHISPDSATKKTIKITSYNIRFSKKVDRAITLLKNNEELNTTDILCLQEMNLKGVQKIAHALKYNYVYYPAALHPKHNQDFGNAVLSKFPIAHDFKFILPQRKKRALQRIAVGAVIPIQKHNILVFSVHAPVFLKLTQRTQQLESLINSIEHKDQPCVIAGDFNTFHKASRRAILTPIRKHCFHHDTKDIGWSYKHWYFVNKKSQLDHMFSRNIECVAAGKVDDHSASDHLPIWSKFTLY